MTLTNIKSKGFTIVELLVVIVVIGILATITFVSYGSVTAKANTSKGQSMASSLVARANIYTIEGSTGTWPLTATLAATSALSASSITGYTLDTDGISAAPATTTTTISYQVCGTTSNTGAVFTAPANLGAITNPTGVQVGYWDYAATPTPGQVFIGAGNTTAGSVGPYRVGSTVYNNLVACYYVAS